MSLEFVPSPNKSSRRGQKPSHIVIHAMQGSYKGSISWMSNRKSGVSAHYLISKSGEVTQMVRDTDKAWHANNANRWTVGIELEDGFFTKLGNGKFQLVRTCINDPDWVTDAMLNRAAEITRQVMDRYGIPIDLVKSRVVGHDSELMRKYGNKHKDPGPYFPWNRFYSLVTDYENHSTDKD